MKFNAGRITIDGQNFKVGLFGYLYREIDHGRWIRSDNHAAGVALRLPGAGKARRGAYD